MPMPVEQVFKTWPPRARAKLLALRRLILATARSTPGVGIIEETLKWGEPAYLTTQTRSGSTVRLGWKSSRPDQVAMYFHCQTNLIGTFKTLFPDEFRYEGNRAVVFDIDDVVAKDALAVCIGAALTYHQRK
jgi:Domain of unknown function (DU1801)